MRILQLLAEHKIQAAIDRGEFDNLAGAGKPLQFEDDAAVPSELRAGLRLLKNAGALPAELHIHQELLQAEREFKQAETVDEKKRLVEKLGLLRMQLERR